MLLASLRSPAVTHLLAPLLAAMPGGWELWIVLLIILILFGSRLPGIARSLGQGIKEFKKGINDSGDEPSDKTRDGKGGGAGPSSGGSAAP